MPDHDHRHGATGALNGATVGHLLDRVPAEQLVVAVRDTTKAQRFADRGVEVRYGDYAEPDSLPGAFEGADQLLLVSSSDPGADAVSLHRSAIDAAVSARVGRILYTSHQGAALDTPFGPGRDHAATEQLLTASTAPTFEDLAAVTSELTGRTADRSRPARADDREV